QEIRESFNRCITNPDFVTNHWTLCLPINLSTNETKWFEQWAASVGSEALTVDCWGVTSGLTTTIWGVGKPCCILELRNKFRENKREQELHCETDRRGTCSSSPDAFRRESSGTQTPPRPHLAQSRCK